jgi:preprotein translocase subunit SecD
VSLVERLLGMSQAPARAPNTFAIWQYVLILCICFLGLVYALPNLYPPDPALQVRPVASDEPLPSDIVDRATATLARAGVTAKGGSVDGRTVLIRLENAGDQLKGREILQAALNEGANSDRYVVALNLASTTPDWLRAIGARPMTYGLDLSGGVHFLLEVDMDKALGDRVVSEAENIRGVLRDERIRYVAGSQWVDGQRIDIPFVDSATRDAAQTVLERSHGDFRVLARDVDGRPGLWLSLQEAKLKEIEDYAIAQNLVSLRNRVNELGVSEPLVQRLGGRRIVVDLPGVQDSADAKRILNKFANLEFRLVASPEARSGETEKYEYEGREITLERRNIVTGDRVTNALQDFDPENGLPQVSITLDGSGGGRMHDATKDNVGNQMAILFKELKPRTRLVEKDGQQVVERFMEEEKRLINVATIRSALGFRFRITGVGLGEARDLALLLRAGALAAPMYIVEERTVGASLGEENVARGLNAAILGFVLIVVFMVIYYKVFGLLADLALAFNAVLLIAVLSVVGVTLTVPGIAAIVLTLGMAVDANVIIFARIKEELETKPPQAAIHAGFDRAFLTILDSNITTLFIGIILLAIASGPVKGFAVVLSIGILTSMFTAVTVTRAFINLAYGGRNVKKLYI